VQSGIYDRFAARLAERVGEFRIGHGLDGPTGQGPLIDPAEVKTSLAHVQDATSAKPRERNSRQPTNACSAMG